MAKWAWLVLLWAGLASAADCHVALAPGAFAEGSIASRWFLSPDEYFADYRKFFEAKGCEVRTVEFPPDATIEFRGIVLRDQVERFAQEAGKPVAVIAHSQAGMDARYALKSLGMKGMAVLITIGTPHEGTPLADWVVSHREQKSLLYWLLRLVGYDLAGLSFAGEFRESFLKEKARYFEAVEGARYASARAVCRSSCHWGLRLIASWTGVGEGDGIVPEESQRFGVDLGEFDLDHISSVDASAQKESERVRFLQAAWDLMARK